MIRPLLLGCALIAGLALAPGEGASTELTTAQRVTLVARPTSLGPTQNATLFGSVESGRAGESVTIQAKDCGLTSFTNISLAVTQAGGTWRLEYGPGVNTLLRAVWDGAASTPVALRQAPLVRLVRRSANRFEVGIGSEGRMWRKRVLIQRRAPGGWQTVRTVVLTDTYSSPGSGGTWTEAEFRAAIPRGSLVRAVLPRSQARPCYLPGVSDTIRA